MVGQKHHLVGNLVLPRIFPVGQNVQEVFRLVGQSLAGKLSEKIVLL